MVTDGAFVLRQTLHGINSAQTFQQVFFLALFTGNRITTEYGMQHAQIL